MKSALRKKISNGTFRKREGIAENGQVGGCIGDRRNRGQLKRTNHVKTW
jgi:hypothetical protein